MTKLQVSEQFYSIQGEGATVGISANFIRLQGCNHKCKWCDTKYTWKNNPDLSISIETILKRLDPRSPRVVITGGEPLLWMDKGLEELVESLSDNGYVIEIETTGSIIPGSGSGILLECVDFWNVSPKLFNSFSDKQETLELSHSYRESIPVFVDLAKAYNQCIFKFVIVTKECIMDVEDFVNKYNVPKSSIYLMPEGVNRNTQLVLMKDVVEMCLEKGWSFSSRLHCLIWDGKRGV